MANKIANTSDNTQQINWTGVRGNRLPIDSSSVMLSYTELQSELNDIDHGTLYAGQYIGVADPVITTYNKPYFVTYTDTYVAHELTLKETFDTTYNDIIEQEAVVSYMTNYLYSSGVDDEEVISLAVTYLYSYTTTLHQRINTLYTEINNTHKKLISHEDLNSYTYWTNIDNTWVTYTSTQTRMNKVIEDLYNRVNDLSRRCDVIENTIDVDTTKHDVGSGIRLWLYINDDNKIALNTELVDFNIFYNKNNSSASGSAPVDNKIYHYGDIARLANQNNMILTGWEVKTWNTRSDGNGISYPINTNITVTGDLTLYAQWTGSSYSNTLIFDLQGGTSSTSLNQQKSIVYPNTASIFTIPSVIPTRSGYTFLYWNANDNGSGKQYNIGDTITVGYNNVPRNQSITLYAQWTEMYYILWGTSNITSSSYNDCISNNTYINVSECPSRKIFDINGGTITNPVNAYFAIPSEWVILLDSDEGWQINWEIDNDEYNTAHNDSIHHFFTLMNTTNETTGEEIDEEYACNNWIFNSTINIKDINYYVFKYANQLGSDTSFIYYKNK